MSRRRGGISIGKDGDRYHGRETMKWKLKRTVQCHICPWLKSVNPHDIPNGYDVEKHRALACTIADPGSLIDKGRAMACHETDDAHCIGWLVNQIGPGNNIGLRIRMRGCENAERIKLRGEQHETFEDTLPSWSLSEGDKRMDWIQKL